MSSRCVAFASSCARPSIAIDVHLLEVDARELVLAQLGLGKRSRVQQTLGR